MPIVPAVRLAAALALSATFTTTAPAVQDDAAAEPPTLEQANRLVQAGDLAGAEQACRDIIEANPDTAGAWFFLGYALHGQGRLTEALPCHLMAAEFDAPLRAIAMYNVACVYSVREHADKAFEWLEKARDAGFRDPNQLETDADMDNVREDPRFDAYLRSLTVGGGGPTSSPSIAEIEALPPQRRFDFWVGNWNVFLPSGDQAGENHIEMALDGRALMEHWRSARGGTGISMNYYDAAKKQWVQVWCDKDGESIVMRGNFEDGAMRLAGTRTIADGTTSRIRGAWSPMSAGRVRQFVEESTDDGKSWSTWFDGTYVRQ